MDTQNVDVVLPEDISQNTQSIFNQFDSIVGKFIALKGQLSGMQHEIRALEKNVKKEFKQFKKAVDVKKKNKVARAPSGFAAPSKVSNELCEFLNKEVGTKVARTEVTKSIIDYIKMNNLQMNEDKKNIIIPDEKLKSLLGFNADTDEPLTFFNIQHFMNKHFISVKSGDSTATI